jgi:hypothetical protein
VGLDGGGEVLLVVWVIYTVLGLVFLDVVETTIGNWGEAIGGGGMAVSSGVEAIGDAIGGGGGEEGRLEGVEVLRPHCPVLIAVQVLCLCFI